MASKRAVIPAKHLFNGFKASQTPMRQCLTRTMATEAPSATVQMTSTPESPPTQPISESTPLDSRIRTVTSPRISERLPYFHTDRPANPFLQTASITLYSFPSFSPTSFDIYPSTHLLLPLRKDILHRAVIFEADNSRSGDGHSKNRYEVHGSNRKIRPQKGSGRARAGDKKSPIMRGGGRAHGPRHRDFATGLPEKVYDLAWRTALSYRFRKGELTVLDGEAEIEGINEAALPRYIMEMLAWNSLGKTLFVTKDRRDNLYSALESSKEIRIKARAIETMWVDVKDLLETPRIVIERRALRQLFRDHESDLSPREQLKAWEASQMIGEGQSQDLLLNA